MIEVNVKVREAIDKYNERRKAKGLPTESDDLIAAASGIHSTTLAKIVAGTNKPSLDTLAKLANYMNIDDLNEFVEFKVVA